MVIDEDVSVLCLFENELDSMLMNSVVGIHRVRACKGKEDKGFYYQILVTSLI